MGDVRSQWAGPRMSGGERFDSYSGQLQVLAIAAGQVTAQYLSGCRLVLSTSPDSLLLQPLLR